MSNFSMQGLRPDQGPPLAVPLSFFFVAPIALVVAGTLVMARGMSTLVSSWVPSTVALTHAGTLGFATMVMMGALYQILPVVAGARVPAVRTVRIAHPLLIAGLGALLVGQGTFSTVWLWWALGCLVPALLLVLGPLAVALVRAPARSDTVTGLGLAYLSLVAVIFLGAILAYARASGATFVHWPAWRLAHLTLGLTCWVGGLLSAVSWQLLPMFYLTAPVTPWVRRFVLGSIALALVGVPLALTWRATSESILLAAAPAAVAVWIAHPAAAAIALKRRRRKRADPSLRFVWLSLACAPLSAAMGVAAYLSEASNGPILFGWILLWGWAGAMIHGMLMRIVPFLVWFHRFAPLAGKEPIPTMRDLWSEGRQKGGFVLHGATLMVGVLAIRTGSKTAAIAMGALLVSTGALMAVGFLLALKGPRR